MVGNQNYTSCFVCTVSMSVKYYIQIVNWRCGNGGKTHYTSCFVCTVSKHILKRLKSTVSGSGYIEFVPPFHIFIKNNIKWNLK
jgi:hypothetical protein